MWGLFRPGFAVSVRDHFPGQLPLLSISLKEEGVRMLPIARSHDEIHKILLLIFWAICDFQSRLRKKTEAVQDSEVLKIARSHSSS